MHRDCDILIIGGGLAGLTAAIHLLKQGYNVLLIEKNGYPKHKVCGEYVSNEVLPYLNSLGVHPMEAGAKAITNFEFSGVTGEALSIKLPLGGFGISRFALDLLLYKRALALGLIIKNETVIDVTFSKNYFKVSTSHKSFTANYVIGAYGKRSVLDRKLSRKFLTTKSPWLGVKAHFNAPFPEDTVGLHNFEGGYCGLSKVETNAVNVCYLADYKTFKKYKNLEEYQRRVVEKNSQLRNFFKNAKPLFKKPLTISQISFENKTTINNHILMAGDSAGLIHPLCGNGMAMAIHSAKIVGECVVKHLKNPISREHLENNYDRTWKLTFTNRMRMGGLIQRGLHHKGLTKFGVRLLQNSPSILTRVIAATHGKLID